MSKGAFLPVGIIIVWARLLASGILASAAYGAPPRPQSASTGWRIYVTNDNCPDYTWGLTEEQTRQSFADIVRAHLDEMIRTDGYPAESRDHYNMAVTQEALCFLERYAGRREELVRRVKEGRVYISPFLCNSLWAFQSVEGVLRTLYPARRLEREWGFPIDVAEHIEEPSLPWGMATILAGCGIRWLSVPFYDYDSTFSGLQNPPLFIYEGPDGSSVRVVMDRWASLRGSYTQGSWLLKDPARITAEWLPHFEKLSAQYPLRFSLASGTHGDISPRSGDEARDFAERIHAYNEAPSPHPRLWNAALPQFCAAVDQAEKGHPFLSPIKGCFGHSWDIWPISLAKYASGMREGEQLYLAAEALLALAMQRQADLQNVTRPERERAEWCWAMLSDHAWNGTDDANAKQNAALRQSWSEELKSVSLNLTRRGWSALGLTDSRQSVVVFNPLSLSRSGLVRVGSAGDENGIPSAGDSISQVLQEDGRRFIYCLVPAVPGFGLGKVDLKPGARAALPKVRRATGVTALDSPYYSLKVDLKTGGMERLFHKATRTELVTANGRRLGELVYFDGAEHTLHDVKSRLVAEGPLFSRLRITGEVAGIQVTTLVTLYARIDRVDIDLRLDKPAGQRQERLCQYFPVIRPGSVLRIETPGAVVRPRPQPEGDLLPGADSHRFAVQGFIDISSRTGAGVTIVPIEPFALRTDLDTLAFEVLGNDQNYKEMIKDQHGQKDFRFRYSIRGHGAGYDPAQVYGFSRDVRSPLLAVPGNLSGMDIGKPPIILDSTRAIATCWKPSEPDSQGTTILRLQEIRGESGKTAVLVRGFRRAVLTDLLERDLRELPIANGRLEINLRANGFTSIRLSR